MDDVVWGSLALTRSLLVKLTCKPGEMLFFDVVVILWRLVMYWGELNMSLGVK